MRLDAWLKQDRPLGERLQVVERLCQAVNAFHGRGEALSALDPTHIELGPEGECDVSAARQGSPAPGYSAPDAGGDASAELADVYSVGAIAWEVLAGRPAGESPAHLFKVRSDLPRELADAVMACLEGSADWRPKDLTYLAQMAAARQESEPRPKTSPRMTRPAKKAAPVRTSSRRGPSRTWPLLAALVLVIGLAAGAAWRYLGPAGTGASGAAPPPQAPTTTAAPATDLIPEAAPTPAPTTTTNPRPATPAPAAPEPVAPVNTTAPAPLPTATPTPTPTPESPLPTPVPEPAVPATATTTTTTPPPDPEPQVEPPAPATTAAPAVLSTVSPLEVKRPGKVMLDLRGTGFGPEHRARVIALKKTPRGITVIGQKLVSDSLITVLLELDPKAETGEFAIAVEDSGGTQSAPAIFKVSK